MKAKLLILLAVVVLGTGAAVYFIKSVAQKRDEANAHQERLQREKQAEQFSKESHDAKRKAAEMLLPDTQTELRFDEPQSGQTPTPSKQAESPK